jgi:hypothetical protein
VYTGLRIALLAAVWLLIQVITPLRGLIAIAVALVISGIISFIVLDRPRDRASVGLAGVFRRIDERIERSKVAEDVDDLPAPSGQGQADAQQHAVGEDERTRSLQDGHEVSTGGTGRDSDDRAQRQRAGDDPEPSEGETESSR